jgi:hypothetical protein
MQKGPEFLRAFSRFLPVAGYSTDTGPFTVDTRTTAGPVPNSIRF